MANDEHNPEQERTPEHDTGGLSEELLAELRAAEEGDADSSLLDNSRVSEDFVTELDYVLEESGMDNPLTHPKPAPTSPPRPTADRNPPENPIAAALQDLVSMLEEEEPPIPPKQRPDMGAPSESAHDLLEDIIASLREVLPSKSSAVPEPMSTPSDEVESESRAPEAPVAEAPVAEEPIAEEPVAEEPVAEEPIAEEPIAEEPIAEDPVVEAPVAEAPVAEAPVAEEPVAEEPVAEEPVAEEPPDLKDEIHTPDLFSPESMADYEELANLLESNSNEDWDETAADESVPEEEGAWEPALALDTEEGLLRAIVRAVEHFEVEERDSPEEGEISAHVPMQGPPPPIPDDPGLTQEELDAFLSSQRPDLDAPPIRVEPEAGGDSERMGEVTDSSTAHTSPQDEIDAVLAAAEAPKSEVVARNPAPSDDSETESTSLSQDDLDALMAQMGGDDAPAESVDAQTGEESASLSQDDLDALMADLTGEAAVGAEPLQDVPDAQVEDSAAQPPVESPASSGGGMANAPGEPDAHGGAPDPEAASTMTPVEPAHPAAGEFADDEDMAPLAEDDLEALIAAVDRDTADSADDFALASTDDVDQHMVDALIEEISATTGFDASADSESLAGGDMDEPLVNAPGEDTASGAPAPAVTDDAVGPVNQDLIDALLASAAGEEVPQPTATGSIGHENVAAAATAPKQEAALLSQADLDALMLEAKENDHSRQRAKEQRLAEAPMAGASGSPPAQAGPPHMPWRERFRRKRAPRAPGPIRTFVQTHSLRIAATILAGATGAMGTFAGLYRSQEQTPSMALLEAAARAPALDAAMRRARELMGAEEYAQAAEVLVEPMAQARRESAGLPAPALVDAEFLHVEAHYRALPATPGLQASETVIRLMERAVEAAPTHPRAPYLLHWKGRLLEEQGMLSAAAAAYDRVIDNYGGAPNLGDVLVSAARLALARKRPEAALEYARRLMTEDAQPADSAEAALLIADAYALGGLLDEARSIYVGMAEDETGTDSGSRAFQRLGEIALARGRYTEAADLFEQRLETATTAEGNDRTYYKLAQAYRQAGRLEEARNALNDLINFFPESAVTPMAYVELAQTLEGLGEQQEALRLAQQAVSRYPENPAVLQNVGEMHGRSGQPGRGAALLVAADTAGAGDPTLLLRAGGYYQDAAMPREALNTYEKLVRSYPRAPQAVRGGIEAAMVLYELGQATEAVQRLENTVATSTGAPHRLPALTGLARIYGDLGLHERLANVAQQIAAVSSEPAVLAQAAQGLIEAGAVEEGMRMAERVDPARLSAREAYVFTLAQGQALLRYAPRRALEKLEEAHFNYPEARTLQGDRLLLDTYLALDQRAAARRIVTDMEAHAQMNPVDTPHLIDAAVRWGDHLSRIGDHREAANAFAVAVESAQRAGELDPETAEVVAWAKYQQANALLENYQFAESVPLLDEIAATGAPWSREASLKAEYARTEQRLRGGPVTPPRASR